MPATHRPLRAVIFDLGETLVSEERSWEAWADWLGVPRARLFAVMRTVIEQGDHHRRIFEILRPGFDLEASWPDVVATPAARLRARSRDRAAQGTEGSGHARQMRPARR